jgi:predicted dehydrogenase
VALRVGLIGLGYWGPHYLRVMTELPEVELVVACDTSESALAIMQERYRTVRASSDPAEVVADDTVDAIVVATPIQTHHPITLAALETGKHVLCEKPLATTTAECRELISASERSGSVLAVGHTFIFSPAVRRMRELIRAGDVGRLLYCHSSRTALGPIRTDVNALWDLAPHDISIFLHLLEEKPISVRATGQAFLNESREDVAFVYLHFENGTMAGAHVSWLDPYKVRRVTVVGDRRMAVFDDVLSDEKLRLFDRGASYQAVSERARGAEFGEFKAIIRDGDITIPRLPATEPLKEQMREFVNCCLTGEEPETGGRAGLEIVAVLEAATESMRHDGAPVELSSVFERA